MPTMVLEHGDFQTKFRNANNNLLSRELFYELAPTAKENVLYTLKTFDHAGYPSLYRLYMLTDDVTEYSFATEYFESWEHWQYVRNASWMKPLADKWNAELQLRSRSRALAKIKEEASKSGREGFAAAKYIAEGWGGGNTRGRPSKAEINQKADEILQDRRRIEEDFKRLTTSMN